MSELTPEEFEQVLTEGDDPTVEDIEKAAAAVPRRGPKQRPGPNDASQGATVPEPPSLPVGEPEEGAPADAPPFLVQRNKFGPGAHGVYLATGEPVGVWLHVEHPSLDGGQVAEMLAVMGLDGDLAAHYGLNRDRARAAAGQLGEMPAVKNFAKAEQEFEDRKEAYREAFIKAQRQKK